MVQGDMKDTSCKKTCINTLIEYSTCDVAIIIIKCKSVKGEYCK